jgi:hypothetical protein
VVKLLDKYVIQVIIMCAVVMAVLIAVLGPAKGISAGGKATDIGGTSLGAVLGFIPRFFTHVAQGQNLANPPKASHAPAQAGS